MPFRDRHIKHFKTLASIRTPRLMTAIGWLVGIGMFAASLFLIFTPWVQTAAGNGVVTALNPNDRVQEINALVSGRIEEFYVRDGASVKKGDPIVRIVDNDPRLIERLEAERAQVVAKLEAAQSAVRTAEIDLNRMKTLFDSGLSARRDYELAQIKVEQLRADVADAAAQLNRIDVNLSRQSAQVVRAPRDGSILRVNAGDVATVVNAGQSIATFAPDNAARTVELFIDGRDIALIRVGAKVRLQFEGWPAVQFSGWPSVAVGTFGGKVISIDPTATPNGQFRVLVAEDENDAPWPDATFVRFGSTARGWILLETVPVGFEIWRQLNNFPPVFPTQAQTAAVGGA